MTSQNSISADKKCNFAYFLETLKRSWTRGVISFSVLFFLAPVILLMACDSYDATIWRAYKDIDGLVSAIGDMYTFYSVVVAIMAVFFAIASFNYLNSRVSVNFYHSLPFKRTRMFFVNYFSGVLMFAAGYVLNYLICIIIPALTDMGFYECLPVITSVFANSLLYFVFIYSITVLVCMTTGLAPVGWLVTMGVMAILPALKVCVNALKSFKSSSFWSEYFFYFEKFLPTSPVVILFKNRAFDTHAKIVMLALALACTFAALVLYHFRLSERSGNPFVFTRFASFVKYAAMLPTSMAFALIFGYMGDASLIWLTFGSISGALVAWMIMNSIINKTARAMFAGVRAMVIFTLTVTCLNLFLVCGLHYVENAMLTPSLIKSVKIEIDSYGNDSLYEFKDKENIKLLLELISIETDKDVEYRRDYGSFGNAEAVTIIDEPSDESYVYIDGEYVKYDEYVEKFPTDDDYDIATIENGYVSIGGKDYYIGSRGSDTIMVSAVAKTVFGYEISRVFTISDIVYDYFELLEGLADSDEYARELAGIIKNAIDEDYSFKLDIEPNMISNGEIVSYSYREEYPYLNSYTYLSIVSDEGAELIEAYEKDVANVNFDFYNSPIIGNIRLRDDDHDNYITLPITLKFSNTLEYLVKCGIINSEDYAADLAHALDRVYVFDYDTEKVMTIDDPSLIYEILKSVDTYDIFSQYQSFFNTTEHRYKVFFDYSYVEEYTYEELVDTNDYEVYTVHKTEKRDGSGTARADFISGAVPTFVSEYFN